MTGMLSRYTFNSSCYFCDFILHLLAMLYLNLTYFLSFYNTKSVVLCLGITAAVCLLVTIFSFQTKVWKSLIFVAFHIFGWGEPDGTNVWCHLLVQFDVTSYQGVLFIFCMVLFISGIVLALILPFKYVSTTMANIFACCHYELKHNNLS